MIEKNIQSIHLEQIKDLNESSNSSISSNKYAKLDEKASPNFIEPKGYVFVGYSRKRMNIKNMPSHEKVRKFSENLAEMTGYEIKIERKDSRVVLLAKDENIRLF